MGGLCADVLRPDPRVSVTSTAKPMNWKVLVEQFLEGYHIRSTHRGTFFPLQYDDLNVVEPFGRNVRVTYPYRNIERLRDREESGWSVRERVTFVCHLFPNVMLATFPDRARVFCVRFEGRPVAASITHWRGGTIEVPWASAIRDFNTLCPNVLLYWHMLSFAIAGGFHTFDLGRSTPGEGTFLFKKQWGAEPQELVWEYWTGGRSMPALNPANPNDSSSVSRPSYSVWPALRS